VREKARGLTCLSNERQIGLGLTQYVQDFDEVLPMDQYYLKDGSQILWFDEIYPYVKNGDVNSYNGRTTGAGGIYHCPSFPSNQSSEYGVHDALMPDGPSCPWIAPGTAAPEINIGEVDAPSDKISVVEKGQNDGNASWFTFASGEWLWTDWVGSPPGSHQGLHYDIDQSQNHDCDFKYSASAPSWSDWGQCGSMPRYRHNNTTNVVFGDGHVKAIVRGKLDWVTNIYIPNVMPTPW
jgi:prepilin-type processing-associated H-X9-DG protein